MKGLFIPEITSEMFRNGCLESIEALMAEGEIYDIEYDPKSAKAERKKGKWIEEKDPYDFFDSIPVCSECGYTNRMRMRYNFCPNCGVDMREGKEE